MKKSGGGVKDVASNRKAKFNYFILESYEAGISLLGAEVKSVRAGKVSINESYAVLKDGEAFVMNMDIAPYENRGYVEYDRRRKRKLLLHKREIRKISVKVEERGFTLIPMRMFFKRGFAKMVIGLAKGKTHGDKRETMKKRDADREIERAMKSRHRK